MRAVTPQGLLLVWLKAQPLTDTHATIVGKGVTWLTEIQEQIHIARPTAKTGDLRSHVGYTSLWNWLATMPTLRVGS